MQLKQLLKLIEEITKRNDLSNAYIVGGLVRDKVLGKLERISDLDLTTGDNDVKYLAKELAIILGKKYNINTKEMKDGHISIFAGDLKIDFSSNFLVAGIDKILQQRGIDHPTDMQKELFSRDFTCNTLLMDLSLKKIADPTGMGLQDIKSRIIRTCLAPEITLTSNKNRVVRAIYLAAKLGFELDKAIVEWVKANPESIKIASAHTLVEKLNDAFDYDAKKSARLISEIGLWGYIPINEKLYPYYKAAQ